MGCRELRGDGLDEGDELHPHEAIAVAPPVDGEREFTALSLHLARRRQFVSLSPSLRRRRSSRSRPAILASTARSAAAAGTARDGSALRRVRTGFDAALAPRRSPAPPGRIPRRSVRMFDVVRRARVRVMSRKFQRVFHVVVPRGGGHLQGRQAP